MALKKNKEVFYATYYSALYLERQIRDMGLRSYKTCPKDATEAIFEYTRQILFPDAVSRISCVFYCETLEEAVQCAMEDWINCGDKTKEEVKILMVDVDDSRIARYDQVLYNEAYEAVEHCNFEKAMKLAENYFAGKQSENPIFELVSDGTNKVVKEIEY